ncbi:MAG: methyltransferase [Vicinamibacterales bacterium]
MTFDPSSKNRLTRHDLARFSSPSLFDRLGRAVCAAGCLPRKELYEAWELARRVRRRFRGGHVVDVGGGHGLLAHVLLLIDRTSPSAVVVDPQPPRSAGTLRAALRDAWPDLPPVTHQRASFDDVAVAPADLVVSCHACGPLADRILARAAAARARVAVMPCCHHVDGREALDGWMDPALAIDARRAFTLQQRDYTVWTATIPAAITPKHRVLMGAPRPPAR